MQRGQVPSGVPNLYYGSLEHDQLRQHPGYIALPPAGTVALSDLHSCRFVRQDDALWRQLHQGVLTTGRLPSALGFLEPRAAKVVGCAKQASHTGLQAAYKHLRQPISEELQRATIHNGDVAAVCTHYSRVNSDGGCGSDGGGDSSSSSHNASSKAVWQHNFSPVQESDSPKQHLPEASGQQTHDAEAVRRQHCEAAAAGGPPGVAQRWGIVQEAASLFAMMQMFEQSVVEEAGLHMLQSEDLPSSWGFVPGTLPLLGASPDATVCHLIPLDTPAALRSAQQLQCALHLANSQQQQQQQQFDTQTMTEHLEVASRSTGVSQDNAVLELMREALALVALRQSSAGQAGMSEATCSKDSDCGHSGSSGISDECNTTDDVQQPEGAVTQQHEEEGGASDIVGAVADSLQQLNFSHATTTSTSSDSSGTFVADSTCRPSSQLVFSNCGTQHSSSYAGSRDCSHVSTSANSKCVNCQQDHHCPTVELPPGWPPVDCSDSSKLYGALTWQAPMEGAVSVRRLQGRCWLMLREPCEVKNTSPYQVHAVAGRRSKKGKRPRVAWAFSDRGPRYLLPPRWVPQLQLHMLATGCWSVLVVCRSASKGLRLYRMYRDNAYLRLMLTYVRELHLKHVLKGVGPSKDAFFQESGYRRMLSSTAALARCAELVASTEGQEPGHHPDADLRQFLPAAANV